MDKYTRMDTKKLLKLVDSLVVLKEKLKCPICLDVIQEVVELDCGHKYCKECYAEHKSIQKQPSCPLCKKALKRRSSLYCDDVYANSLGKFVYNCSENVRRVYGCEVEQLKKTLTSGEEVAPKASPAVLKQNVSNKGKTDVLPTKSKTAKKETKKSKENQEDAFDKLMNAAQIPSAFNKKGTKRVYTNKKKEELKPKLQYNILEFDNYENKTAVLQWLNDTRNRFDRLTQTQNFFSEEVDIPVIDLDSVSQFREKVVNSKPVVQKSGRAKSLDIEIKKPVRREKRYSDGGRSVLAENYDIEDVNTEEEKVCKKAEEKVLLEVIEDEFLNKLEQEMHGNDNEPLKSNKKKRHKKHVTVPSQASSTGWDRLTKIEKSIKKTERVPKQLNITLQPTHGSETKSSRISVEKNNPSTSQMPNTYIRQDVSKKGQISVPRDAEMSNSDNKILKVVLPKFDVNTFLIVSRYLKETCQKEQQNIFQDDVGATKDGNNAETSNACHVDEGEGGHKNVSEFKRPELLKHKEKTLSYDLNKLEDYIAKNMKAIESGKAIDEDAVTSPQTEQEKEVSEKDIVINATTDQVKIHNDVAFEMPTQKIINVNSHCQEKSAAEVIILNDDDEEMEAIFARPTQKSVSRHPDDTKKSSVGEDTARIKESVNVITVDDDLNTEEMYCMPTQEIIHNCKDPHQVLSVQGKCDSVEGLLHLVEESMLKCLENLQSTDIVVESQLQNLQYYVTKLKSLKLYERDKSVESDNRNVCDATTQTLVATSAQHIQTEVKHQTIGLQTESIHCHKCNVDLNDNEVRPKLITQRTEDAMKSMLSEPEITFKPVTQPKASKAPSQNDIFTASFDDLNFETQDLTKNGGSLVRNTKTSPKVATLPSRTQASPSDAKKTTKPSLPSSVLVCSLTATDSKKVSRRLNFEGEKSKKFKRIRTLSDSDSDDEPEGKKLCNRFVRDDLTIEFQTNTERVQAQNESHPRVLDSQDSEGINYDEYLAQIMKKYDTNTSSGSSKSAKEPAVLTPNKELMRKCEEMLEKSTKTTKNVRKICGFTSDSSKDGYQTASNSVSNNEALTADKMFMDEHNLSKLEKDIQNYEQETVKVQNSETSDIISNTEEEPVVKKFRRNNTIKNNSQLATLFCQSQNDDVHMPRPKHDSPVANNPESDSLFGRSENLNSQVQEVKGSTTLNRHPESASLFCETGKAPRPIEGDPICIELDDSFDDGELENIDIPDIETNIKKVDKNREGKIKILDDVVIRSPVKVVDDKEDEIFSDEDIVETTPQKRVDSFGERCDLSQLTFIGNPLIRNLTVPKSDTENFDFDFVPLPPPPDFQDDKPANNDMEDIASLNGDDDTVTNLNKGSLTPDRLSQFVVKDNKETFMSQILSTNMECGKDSHAQNNLSLTPDKLSQFDANPVCGDLIHSSPIPEKNLTRDTLGFSPIPLKKTPQLGITEMVAAAKYTPLSSISKHTPQKQNLFTSTPRQKSIWNYVKPSQSNDNEVAALTKAKPCIACTRLTKEQIKLISQLTNKKLATYSPLFDSSVTHMIVAVNENNHVKDYTIKFVSAVAAGIWVLRYEWIEECLRNNCIVPEEPFEALDISGMPGPKTSRLTRKQNPLFKGFKFFCAKPFLSTTKEEIESILTMLEGKVLKHLKSLMEDDGNIGLIIGEGHATQDFEQFERWLGMYKTVTVDIEWLSKCVGQYKLLSIRPYVWCSEDNLGDLGYPPNLIESVPLSFSETF